MTRAAAVLVLLGLAVGSCVPEGPATDRASQGGKPAGGARPKPAASAPAANPNAGAPITAPFEDAFERAEVGPDYNVLSPKWRIQKGRLCARGARNKGVWLMRRLPVNARIEFDATSDSADGDIKVELWGDGASSATQASYSNATSYLLILGGWKNSKHVLARLDEHGEDRLEIDVDATSDDERARPVEQGQVYRFRVERKDGKTMSWSVGVTEYFELEDPEPLAGPGHEHLGFNDWDVPVCFDNLRITPL